MRCQICVSPSQLQDAIQMKPYYMEYLLRIASLFQVILRIGILLGLVHSGSCVLACILASSYPQVHVRLLRLRETQKATQLPF